MNTRTFTASVARPALLILGILLIAANLRAPVTGVAPLLGLIQPEFGLSNAEAGILTTLPPLHTPFRWRSSRVSTVAALQQIVGTGDVEE
eukprot:gene8135-10037_t